MCACLVQRTAPLLLTRVCVCACVLSLKLINMRVDTVKMELRHVKHNKEGSGAAWGRNTRKLHREKEGRNRDKWGGGGFQPVHRYPRGICG